MSSVPSVNAAFDEWLESGDPSPMDVLRFMFSKGRLVGSNSGRFPQVVWTWYLLPMLPGEPIRVEEAVFDGLTRTKMIERCGKSPMNERYYDWQVSDEGLAVLGKPTRKEMATVELVSGPDVRAQKTQRRRR